MNDTIVHPDQASRLRDLVAIAPATPERPHDAPPPSVPEGAVSFRPRPGRRTTEIVHRARVAAASATASAPASATASSGRPAAAAPIPRLAHAIAVTSGKGGVGKSNLAVNLAVTLSQLGRKVCLLDADLGLANADVLCNITPKVTLQHVVAGRCSLAEIMRLAPGGFRLIPGASGVAGMANLGRAERAVVFEQLVLLDEIADVVIIDCAAGISPNVLAFAVAAHTTLVTTTPEPTALTDAYGMIKSLSRYGERAAAQLVVNMVDSLDEARGIHERMNRVTEAFLSRQVGFAGAVPFDVAVPAAVRHRLPFALFAPDGPATAAVRQLARGLIGLEEEASARPRHAGFFARVAAWLDG